MANFDASSSSQALLYNGSEFLPNGLLGNTTATPIHTSTHFQEILENGWVLDIFGSEIIYSGDGGPINGTISEFAVSQNGKKQFSVENVNVSLATYLAIDEQLAATNSYVDDAPYNAITLAGSDLVVLGSGNDKFAGFAGNDVMDGRAGLDTAVFLGAAASYRVSNSVTNITVVADSGTDGSDSLSNFERLQFSDKNIAFDVDGNAGQAMEFIGVVAPALLNSSAIRGVIISLFDQGQTMEGLSQLALDLDLVPKVTNAQLANAVFANVTGGGVAPQELTNTLVSYIESHSQANFVATVASMHINVDLVGLQQTGIEYTL